LSLKFGRGSVRDVDPAAEGKVYPPVSFEVTPAHVESFRAVVGGPEGVPPTFATAAEFTAMPQVVADRELALDFTRVVHGSQAYEHHRPMRAGERLTATLRIETIRVRGLNGFLTIVTELTDAGGDLVCTATSTMIERAPA
jgi:N-terminal half of MaoC dehydratase